MNDGALEAALYASRRSKRGHRRIAEPDWATVHRELKRKHVTLLILWDEYIAANPGERWTFSPRVVTKDRCNRAPETGYDSFGFKASNETIKREGKTYALTKS